MVNHNVIFDRIEAGTYLVAGALSGKKIVIKDIKPKILKCEMNTLKKMGAKITFSKNSISIIKSNKLKKVNITTQPYPGFPTDLQANLWF